MRAAMFPGESLGFSELHRLRALGIARNSDFPFDTGEIDPNVDRDRLKVQLAVYSISAELWDRMKDRLQVSLVVGHSLGYYAALYASGAMGKEEGHEIIKRAHTAIQDVSSAIAGGMSAIIGLKPERVDDICSRIPGVFLANINSATQVVISGTRKALEEAEQAALHEGALSVKRLAADSPLHSPLMRGVKEIMEKSLDGIVMRAPKIPIVSHTSAELLTSMEQVRNVLCNQFTERVLWRDAVNFMFDRGVREFVEIGPSDMLSKLVKWIQRSAVVYTASGAMEDSAGGAIPGKESIHLNRSDESMNVQP